jgi:hypothetical protein
METLNGKKIKSHVPGAYAKLRGEKCANPLGTEVNSTTSFDLHLVDARCRERPRDIETIMMLHMQRL